MKMERGRVENSCSRVGRTEVWVIIYRQERYVRVGRTRTILISTGRIAILGQYLILLGVCRDNGR